MKPKTTLQKTKRPGNHPYALKYILLCPCGHIFGANSCDVHLRLCPKCEGGAPGLPINDEPEAA
jgi:hypothetical protein